MYIEREFLIYAVIIFIMLIFLIIELLWVLLKNAIKHGVKQGMYNCVVQLIDDGIISIQNGKNNEQEKHNQY